MTQEEKQQLNELLEWKRSFDRSGAISLTNDQVFRGRFRMVSDVSTGASSTQNISLTGDPQTITVPATPTGTLKVINSDGKIFELLYK